MEEAHKIAELHVYTMGDRGYAVEMAKLLDPTKRFFNERVISQVRSLPLELRCFNFRSTQ